MDCNTVSASPRKIQVQIIYGMCVCMKESTVLLRWQIDLKSASAFVPRVNNDENTKNERLRMIAHVPLPPLLLPLHRFRSKLCHSFINLDLLRSYSSVMHLCNLAVAPEPRWHAAEVCTELLVCFGTALVPHV